MDAQPTGIFYLNSPLGAIKPFPGDLRRGLFSRLDPKFLAIFFGLFLVAGITIWILAHQKISNIIQQKDIIKIQERYAQLVLNQPKPKIEQPIEPIKKSEVATTEAVSTEETKAPVAKENETFVEKEQRKEVTRVDRAKKREQVARQVQSSGIFAAITAVGSGSGGKGPSSASVTDFLGAASEGVSDIGSIKVSKGMFAAREEDAAAILQARKSGKTAGTVGIEKNTVGRTGGAQLASAGSVSVSSAAPEIIGEQSSNSNRTQSAIFDVIQRYKKQIERVYEDALKRDPELSGNLKVKFTILPSGTVTNATIVMSTTNNPEFDQTVLRYIKRWTFPAIDSGEPIEVIYPFAFTGSH